MTYHYDCKTSLTISYKVELTLKENEQLNKFDSVVIGSVQRTAGNFENHADPLTSLELLNYYLTLTMSRGRMKA